MDKGENVKPALPTPDQLAARKTLEAALRQHQHLDPIEMCAVVAHFLGQLIALQDQARLTSDQVMEIVNQNIEAGNREIIESFLGSPGRRH